MKNFTRIAPVLIAGALGIAACGGDSDGLSGDDAELASALADVWESDGTFPEGVSVDCAAEGFVSGIGGADGADSYGVNADNVGDSSFDENPLSRDDAVAAAGEMFDCDGFKTWFASNFTGSDDAEANECLADELSDEPVEALFASSFMDGGDESAALEEEYENDFESELTAGLETCEIGG